MKHQVYFRFLTRPKPPGTLKKAYFRIQL